MQHVGRRSSARLAVVLRNDEELPKVPPSVEEAGTATVIAGSRYEHELQSYDRDLKIQESTLARERATLLKKARDSEARKISNQQRERVLNEQQIEYESLTRRLENGEGYKQRQHVE